MRAQVIMEATGPRTPDIVTAPRNGPAAPAGTAMPRAAGHQAGRGIGGLARPGATAADPPPAGAPSVGVPIAPAPAAAAVIRPANPQGLANPGRRA